MATDVKQMDDTFEIKAFAPFPNSGASEQPSTSSKKPSSNRQSVSNEHQTPVKRYQTVSSQHQSASKARPSAVFSGSSIDAKRPIFERSIGLALLTLSFICTVMTFNGYWGLPSIKAVLIGVGLQGLATSAEWFWRNQRMSIWYMIAIVFDAGMSVKGFSIPLLEPFKRIAANISTEVIAPFAAWGLIVILSLALAVLPEVILIDKD